MPVQYFEDGYMFSRYTTPQQMRRNYRRSERLHKCLGTWRSSAFGRCDGTPIATGEWISDRFIYNGFIRWFYRNKPCGLRGNSLKWSWSSDKPSFTMSRSVYYGLGSYPLPAAFSDCCEPSIFLPIAPSSLLHLWHVGGRTLCGDAEIRCTRVTCRISSGPLEIRICWIWYTISLQEYYHGSSPEHI